MRRSLSAALLALAATFPAHGQIGTAWTMVTPAMSPPRLVGAPIVYDSLRRVVVLFGGTGGGAKDQTWEYDGSTWTLRTPATSPPKRAFMAMAYDSTRHVTVLFGGRDGSVSMNDTWEWDGNNWTQRSPATSPPPQSGESMAYDAARQRVVMFSGDPQLPDTWEWDGNNWTLAATTLALARGRTATIYDPVRQRVVLFGGTPDLSDTWEWDGNSWTRRNPIHSPPGRSEHAMAYDGARRRVVMFGGLNGGVQQSDTWEWDGTDWTQRLPASMPAARDGHAMAFDEARGVVVLYGQGSADTWEYAPVQPGSYIAYGQGCAGTAGTPTLGLEGIAPPYAGDSFTLAAGNLGTSLALVAFGVSSSTWLTLPLPFDLTSFGMPGCRLLASAELSLPLANSGGTATLAVSIPSSPVLVGQPFYNQVAVFDASANPGGLVFSNAATGVIGDK